MIDLPPEDLAEVQRILKEHVPQYKVVAFGSRVNRKAKIWSDLDLCIIGNKPLSLKDTAMLEDAFSISNLPIKVDIVDWAGTENNFRCIIQKNSIVIQDPEKTRAH
jgi:predicted nucleotidyltransferase